MTVAYAENAVQNGAEVSLNTVVLSMTKEHGRITSVKTNRGTVYPKVVINAAGTFADIIADMAGDQFFSIHPRKGEILFLDKKKGELINGVIGKPSLTQTKSNTKGGGCQDSRRQCPSRPRCLRATFPGRLLHQYE